MFKSSAKRLTGLAGALAAVVMVSAVPLLAPSPAYAQPHDWHGGGYRPAPPRGGWHGGGWHGGGWHGGGWHGGGGYSNNTGAIVGGTLLGLGVGAAIGSLVAPPPVAYAPPPAYYPPAPPPVYYGY